MSARRTEAQEHALVRRAAMVALEKPEVWLEEIGRRMMRERNTGRAEGLVMAAAVVALALVLAGEIPEGVALGLFLGSVLWKVIALALERLAWGPRKPS